MLRINLLRHLPAPENAPAPETPRGGAGKRLLGVLVALALAAGAAWLFLFSPYASRLEWRRLKPAPAPTEKAEPRPAPADSARAALEALEARAVAEIAALQRDALALSRALEAFLPGEARGPARGVTRAVLSPPSGFVLRGRAASPEALSRLQETLVLVPGLDLARSESRDPKAGRGVEFLFAGTVRATADSVAADSFNAYDSSADAAATTPATGMRPDTAGGVLSLPDEAALDRAWTAFLETAAAAGVMFTTLPAGSPTVSGSLKAHPYRVQATCAPAILREFLGGLEAQGSPFGIRRVTWDLSADSPAKSLVSLDIMAFSRR